MGRRKKPKVFKFPASSEFLDYITCPYPQTANFKCGAIIPLLEQYRPERCWQCGRGI